MRIWSFHPEYLDQKGIVAVWRESLLARKVLEGKTRGYRNHPQLIRFTESGSGLDAINFYLAVIHAEAEAREYRFDKEKVNWNYNPITLEVTEGQLEYEVRHLLDKLKTRDPKRYLELSKKGSIKSHPLFCVIKGGVENWEKR